MAALYTFPVLPVSPGSERRRSPRIHEVELGDGYVQRAGRGINNLGRSYRARWEQRLLTELDPLDAFLEARGGVEPFYFTIAGDVQRQWICKTWSRTRRSAIRGDLLAEFVEDFGP